MSSYSEKLSTSEKYNSYEYDSSYCSDTSGSRRLSHHVYLSEDLIHAEVETHLPHVTHSRDNTTTNTSGHTLAKASYSTDTFEDITESDDDDDDDDDDYDGSINQSSVTYSDTFEDSNDSISSSTDHRDQSSQINEAQAQFVSALFQRLAKKKRHDCLDTGQLPPKCSGKNTEISKEGRKFCNHLIQKIKKGALNTSCEPTCTPPSRPARPLTQYGIQPLLLERVRLRCILAQMKQAANYDIHDPGMCDECRQRSCALDGEAAKAAFIQDKTAAFKKTLTEDALATHLVTMDSVNLIGQISRSLPRPTTAPAEIDRRLLGPLHQQRQSDNKG